MTSSDPALTANLITGRTVEQGVAIEGWKDKQEYVDAAGFVHIDPSEFKTLTFGLDRAFWSSLTTVKWW
jgi:formylmethanofuran dehydrogenase subunit D